MRRKERSGPGIMNSDVATAGALGLAESPALAGKQPQEKTEATTKMEKHRGNFTAGFLSEPTRHHATGARRGEQGGEFIREIEECRMPGLVIPGPDPKF